MFLDSHKVFCRFFTNVRMIIATGIVVPLSLCRVKGGAVFILLYTAIWLTLFPVRIKRFQATWWINVLTLIDQISKANPYICIIWNTGQSNCKIIRKLVYYTLKRCVFQVFQWSNICEMSEISPPSFARFKRASVTINFMLFLWKIDLLYIHVSILYLY